MCDTRLKINMAGGHVIMNACTVKEKQKNESKRELCCLKAHIDGVLSHNRRK